MNHDDEIPALEEELRGMAMRQPPAEWKAVLLGLPPMPPPTVHVPWFPKPLAFLLTGCWLVAGGFRLATPEIKDSGAPRVVPPSPSETGVEEFLLGYNTPGEPTP